MKSFAYALILALVITACSDHEEKPIKEDANNALLVFMPYTGDSRNLYENFKLNLHDMERAIKEKGGLGDNTVLVFISSSSSKSDLFRIRYERGQCIHDTLRTYLQNNYTTADGIAQLMSEMKGLAKAKSYGMVIGCHGEGWIPKSSRKNISTRYFGGTSAAYRIDVSDFAQGLADAGLHLRYLLFDDCYMSGIEVAYELRGITDYLIASTSEIMAYGMPYHKILPALLDTPDYERICTEFLNFYNAYTVNGKSYPYGAIGVTDCRVANEMATTMKQVNALCSLDPDRLQDIQDLDGGHWNPTVYFDFGDYLQKLCEDHPDMLRSLQDLLQRLVPYKACTENIYSEASGQPVPVNSFSGITISDPSVNSYVLSTKQQTAWWLATH